MNFALGRIYNFFGFIIHVPSNVEEKVVIQNSRNTHEEPAVDGRTTENVVNIGAMTVYLLGEPLYSAITGLTFKNIFNKMAYVRHGTRILRFKQQIHKPEKPELKYIMCR